MKFANIEYLYLIWVIPLLLAVFSYGARKRRRLLKKYATEHALRAISINVSVFRRKMKAGLIILAAGLIIFALTGPKIGYKWREVERKGIDIMIALDCSSSMLAEDLKPTRLDRAKREILDLLHMLQGDRVGLVAFAGTAFLQCPLTLDYETFYIFLDALTPEFLPTGGTNLAGAISTSLSGFSDKGTTEKAVILITDGENTGPDNPLDSARQAASKGVKLFCIGVGKGTGAPIPLKEGGFKKNNSGKIILTRLDQEMLKKIAAKTGGAYVRSTYGDMDLESIYKDRIRANLKLETLTSGRKKIWEDRYQWFVALAMIALMVELFLSSGRKRRVMMFLILLPLAAHPVEAGHLKDGQVFYEKGEYEKALNRYIDAQLEHPEKAEILYNIGNTYYRLGNFQAAYDHFKQAVQSENVSLKQKSLYNLGNAGVRRGMLEDAVKNYSAALKIDPRDEQAKQNLEFVKRMIEQRKKEQPPGENSNERENRDNKNKQAGRSGLDRQSGRENRNESASRRQEGQKKDGENRQNKPGKKDDSKTQGDLKKRDDDSSKAGESGSGKIKSNEQARRMLNRLKDMPGKAMIPDYQTKRIEKDW